MRKGITIAVAAVFAVLALTEAASAYYSPAKGRFLARDPIGEEGGLNLSAYVKNDAIGQTDPAGLRSFQIDEKKCEITLKFTVEFKWKGAWTDARKSAFRRSAEEQVESAFNKGTFRIYAALKSIEVVNTKKSCCPCSEGWVPKVDFVSAGWFSDFTLSVQAGGPTTSSAQLGGPNANLDELDVVLRQTGGGHWQVPIAHEFGHLLGIDHPGAYLTPPAPPGTTADYTADSDALMGEGMQLRPSYFDGWKHKLDQKYHRCADHWIG